MVWPLTLHNLSRYAELCAVINCVHTLIQFHVLFVVLEKKRKHRAAYKNAIEGKVTVGLRVVRFNNIGLPRSGKTSFRKRMMRLIRNIMHANIGKEEPSTGVVECGMQIIRKTHTEITMVSSKQGVWSVLKNEEDEAKLLNELIDYAMNKPSPSVALSSSCASLPNEPEASQNISTRRPAVPGSILTSDDRHAMATPPEEKRNPQKQPDICKEEDIEEIFTFLNKAMKESDLGKVKHLLDDLTLIINTDVGGQAEFLAMYGSLVSGPSFNLLFRRLTDELGKAFEIYYTDEHGKSTEKETSTVTVEEVLFQALSSIAGFGGSFSDDDDSKSMVMFVGTHRDLVSADEFRESDELLKQKVMNSDFFKKNMVVFASDDLDELMFAVDNLTGEEDEIEPIRRKLETVIEENFSTIEIPVAWLILNLCIRSKKVHTMSLTECEELAKKLNIGPAELQQALWFLHHCVGLLLYYPELEELRDTVICDLQVVFDSTSNLIENTFVTSNKVSAKVCSKFKETAQFSLKDVKKATGDIFPLPKLVKLLEHLSILTPLPKEQGSVEPTYFMPCVLRSARADELKVIQSVSDPAPLMLHYECGYVPLGVFPAMITNLVSRQKELDWKMMKVLRNKVDFKTGKDHDVITVILHPRYFEITIARNVKHEKPTESLCSEVLTVMESTHGKVTSKMNYEFCLEYKFGFECPDHQTRDHICVVADKNASRMKCLQDETSFPLEGCHSVWFRGELSDAGGFVVTTFFFFLSCVGNKPATTHSSSTAEKTQPGVLILHLSQYIPLKAHGGWRMCV